MPDAQSLHAIRAALGQQSVVLVGLMGCGKSAIGRRLAAKLALPFVDADEEIEKAAGKSIEDIFADHGEPYFREGERKVLSRLLRSGPQVLATGGGAFMNEETRAAIAEHGDFGVAAGPSCRCSCAASASAATVRCSREGIPRPCCRTS